MISSSETNAPQATSQPDDTAANSSQSQKIKGLIFDMDGTIIDSIPQDFKAWNKALENYDTELDYEVYMKDLGAKGEKIVRKHVDISEEEATEFTQQKDKIFAESIQQNGLDSMPHIRPILVQARKQGMKIALATGSKDDKLDLVFEHVDLRDFFDVIITADDVEQGKPNGEVFLKAAKKLGLEPDEVIVWEDATLGVQAAKDAKMKCVCITTTQKGDTQDLEQADILLDTYEGLDLMKLINQLS